MGLISGKLCRFLCFWLALLHSVSSFFPLYLSSSLSLWTVFDSISSNIDEVLLINPSTNVFVFGNFSIHQKDWLTCFGGTNRPGELCYNSAISNDLNQMVSFPTLIPECFSQACSFGFISSDTVFVQQWLSLHHEILIMLSQFPLTFHETWNKVPCFIA